MYLRSTLSRMHEIAAATVYTDSLVERKGKQPRAGGGAVAGAGRGWGRGEAGSKTLSLS